MLRKFFTCSQNIIHFIRIADQHRLGALGSVQEIIVLPAAAILRQTGIFPTPRITDRTGASAAVLQQLVQPIGQLRIIGRCIERHTDLAQESRVVNALMRFSVCRNKTRAVNGEHDVLLQQVHIVQDLIVRALQEGGVNAHHRQHALTGQTRRKGHGVLLCHAHVKEPLRRTVRKELQPGAIFHGRSNGTDAAVLGRFPRKRLPEVR